MSQYINNHKGNQQTTTNVKQKRSTSTSKCLEMLEIINDELQNTRAQEVWQGVLLLRRRRARSWRLLIARHCENTLLPQMFSCCFHHLGLRFSIQTFADFRFEQAPRLSLFPSVPTCSIIVHNQSPGDLKECSYLS